MLSWQGISDLGMGKIEFVAVFDRRQCKLPDVFYGIKKILIVAKVITFLNPENTYNYIKRANFNRDFLKMVNFDTKIDTSPTFLLVEV